jgi:hypothetical protein
MSHSIVVKVVKTPTNTCHIGFAIAEIDGLFMVGPIVISESKEGQHYFTFNSKLTLYGDLNVAYIIKDTLVKDITNAIEAEFTSLDEFKELVAPEEAVQNPAIDEPQQPLILTQKPYVYKKYPFPDGKLLEKGCYINAGVVSSLIGITPSRMKYLVSKNFLKAYRTPGAAHLLFLLDDVVEYIKNKKK